MTQQETELSRIMNFTVEDGLFGPKFVLRGYWRDAAEQFMRENKIHELDLNYAKNWPKEEIAFLRRLEFLVNLQLIMPAKIDLSPIEALVNLRSLRADGLTSTKADLTGLTKLDTCYVEWQPKLASVLICSSLTDLYLQSFKHHDCHGLAALGKLEVLRIGNGPLNTLAGIECLRWLRFLGLYNLRKLSAVPEVRELAELRELDVWGCKNVEAIAEDIGSLANLESITLFNCGDIQSLAPLGRLTKLRSLSFGEDTCILDGDISVLLDMPSLGEVCFNNRRHYSHTREQIVTLLGSRDA